MDMHASPPELDSLRCLVLLDRERDWARAAEACGIPESRLADAVRAAEAEYRHAIVWPGPGFQGFTPEGERVLAWAKDFHATYEALKESSHIARRRETVSPLLARRSVSPKRLCAPGPGTDDLDLLVQAALRAPDHGSLHPWRLIEFHADQREALAERFEQEKRRRDPLASPADLQLAREHALRPPVLMAFVVSPKARTQVPVREQWLAAGAALGNLLNAAHQLGFGAIVLSGERCFDPVLCAELGVLPEEFLAGFISFGSVAEAPPPKKHAAPAELRARWQPAVVSRSTVDDGR